MVVAGFTGQVTSTTWHVKHEAKKIFKNYLKKKLHLFVHQLYFQCLPYAAFKVQKVAILQTKRMVGFDWFLIKLINSHPKSTKSARHLCI